MEVVFRLPVESSPELKLVASPWSGRRRIFVDGVEVPGVRRGRVRVHTVTLPDGRTAELELRNKTFDMLPRGTLLFGNPPALLAVEIGRPLAWWEYALAALPIVLLAGGILGGIFGVLAAYTNLRLIRSDLPTALRVLATLAVFLATAFVYVILAVVLAAYIRSR
jgi:hypothetical protein